MQSEGRLISRPSRHLIRRATSFHRPLHPSSWPTFLFFRDFLFYIRNFHVRCSRARPHFWERTASACIIHLCSVFARPPPFCSYCISFLRISLFSSYVHPYVLSIWRAIRSLLLPSSRTFGFPLTSLPAASKLAQLIFRDQNYVSSAIHFVCVYTPFLYTRYT